MPIKTIAGLASAAIIFSAAASSAKEFTASVAAFSADFQEGWQEVKTQDPSIVLRMEKGKSFVDFVKLEQTLSERHLKLRVREQIESLKSKGTPVAGDVRQVSLHGGANAYYTSYLSGKTDNFIAFLACNGGSFSISAAGLSEEEFRAIVRTIRKPGEKIDPLKPHPKKVKAVKKKAPGGR